MMAKKYTKMALIALAAASLFFAGCGGKGDAALSNSQQMMDAKQAQADADAAALADTGAMGTSGGSEGNMAEKPSTNSVYFTFDSANIDDAGNMILVEYAAWLNANADVSVTVEGHCDERGSKEYNLALGDQRASMVRDVLVANGVAAGRVDTVSYGEGRAVCSGTGQACWAQNRHGDVVNR
ncbi:MAG: OmpA family protein [Mariprofundaceae bacterium]|nr:OmpA family protein [Mariprofundaceae bacterium]